MSSSRRDFLILFALMIYLIVVLMSLPLFLYARSSVLSTSLLENRVTVKLQDLTYALDDDRTWQLIQYPNDGKNLTITLYKAYFDTRTEGASVVRAFVVTEGYLYRRLFCYLWYHESNLSYAVRSYWENIEITPYKANGIHYSQYMVICPIRKASQRRQGIPHHVSIALEKCGPYATYLPVIQPKPQMFPGNPPEQFDIGLCLSAQYGNVSDSDTPFFVQWMESSLHFGVSQIIWYNATMRDIGPMHAYTKAMRYYHSIGKLVIIQLPLPYGPLTSTSVENEYEAAETVRLIATNDCLYTNLNKYSFILHVDKDELVVPSSYNTYQQFLTHFLNSTTRADLESIVIPSAFYYRFFSPAREDIPEYLPLHRLLYRTAVGNPVGYYTSKSFINTINCVSLWNHRCTNGNLKYRVADKADIHVHHYRNSCRTKNGCEREWEARMLDTKLPDQYGEELEARTMDVLRKLNYLKN